MSQLTRKVFWEDPYLSELETKVSGVNSDEITLEATLFYALSGGQESDSGTIGGRTVLQARKDGSQLFYRMASGHCLKEGELVTVRIDFERRYRLMRLHFAAEIVLELITGRFPGIEKIGAHIAADKARIDFLWTESLSPHLPMICQEAMKLVTSKIKILSAYSDEEKERRYWEIPGFARVPCGGTHLRSTDEIGEISLKRDNIGKGKERVVIKVNDKAPPPPLFP